MSSEGIALKGRCACGDIKVEVAGPVQGPYQCFCRQCQHASGGAGAVFVLAPEDAVSVTGDLRDFAEPTRSGNRASRSFCPRCGTAVCSRPASAAGALALKASLFAPDALGAVLAVFWTSEAPAWVQIPPAPTAFETQP